VRSSPPPEAQLGPPPARARATPIVNLAPPVSRAHPRSLATTLSLAGGPCLSAPSPAPMIRLSARLPMATARPVASPLTRSLARFGALRPRALCPSRPVATACPSRLVATVCHHRRRSKRRQCSLPLLPSPSPSPSPSPTDRPEPLTSPHQASATPPSFSGPNRARRRRPSPLR
jgi:hypothetical protein